MKKLVSGLIACVMLFSLASCDLGGSGKDKRDREKSDDIKTEKELEETETETTVTSETEETTTSVVFEEPTEVTTVPTFAKNDGDLLYNLDDVVALTVAGLGSDYKDFLNLTYMAPEASAKNLEKGIRNYAYIWRGDSDTDPVSGDIIKELTVNIYIFEVDTASDNYKNLKEGGMLTFFNGYGTEAAVITAINKQYVLCIYAKEFNKDDKTIEETLPEFTLGNAQAGYKAFIDIK